MTIYLVAYLCLAALGIGIGERIGMWQFRD